jgi:hypothetical protein
MTQAFNLSQLANGVNTSGQLNAAANLYNQVPVANGGTNASSFTGNAAIISNAGGTALSSVAAGANGNVLTSNGTTWISTANVASTNVNTMILGTASGTWTKPATVKSIKVTVVGGGGNGGNGTGTPTGTSGGAGGGGGTAIRYYPAASLPGPQPYTVGGGAGTSSFGVAPSIVVSATGGGTGANGTGGGGSPGVPGTPGAGGTGSNGQLNVAGSGVVFNATSIGGASLFSTAGNASLYGGGGKGGDGFVFGPAPPAPSIGTTGAAGFVMIEEFY